MKNQNSGCIVNITSQAGVFYSKGQGCHYAATKAAIIHLTRVLAFELGPLGIRINSIAPGSISLDSESASVPSTAPDRRPPDAIPVGHLGSPDDVAQAVLFFTSERSRFVTGQTLLVNGGVIT
jgi:3-oxoacyl-[acyl-carrier protein] reductase